MDPYYKPEDTSLTELFKYVEWYDRVFQNNSACAAERKSNYYEKTYKPAYTKTQQDKGKNPVNQENSKSTEQQCFTCDGKEHMAKDCLSKKPECKTKVKKETSSNWAE